MSEYSDFTSDSKSHSDSESESYSDLNWSEEVLPITYVKDQIYDKFDHTINYDGFDNLGALIYNNLYTEKWKHIFCNHPKECIDNCEGCKYWNRNLNCREFRRYRRYVPHTHVRYDCCKKKKYEIKYGDDTIKITIDRKLNPKFMEINVIHEHKTIITKTKKKLKILKITYQKENVKTLFNETQQIWYPKIGRTKKVRINNIITKNNFRCKLDNNSFLKPCKKKLKKVNTLCNSLFNPDDTKYGRDIKDKGIKNIEVLKVWAVNNQSLSRQYNFHKSLIVESCETKYFEPATDSFEEVDQNVNEIISFHGSSLESIQGIVNNGFNPLFSKKGMFGKGIYSAEEITKIVQYTDTSEIAYGIITKTTLGNYYKTTTECSSQKTTPCKKHKMENCICPNRYDSLIAMPQRSGKKSVIKRHAEFIVTNPHQIIPIYVFAFRKNYSSKLEKRTINSIVDTDNTPYELMTPEGNLDCSRLMRIIWYHFNPNIFPQYCNLKIDTKTKSVTMGGYVAITKITISHYVDGNYKEYVLETGWKCLGKVNFEYYIHDSWQRDIEIVFGNFASFLNIEPIEVIANYLVISLTYKSLFIN